MRPPLSVPRRPLFAGFFVQLPPPARHCAEGRDAGALGDRGERLQIVVNELSYVWRPADSSYLSGNVEGRRALVV